MSKRQAKQKNKYNYLAQYSASSQWNIEKIPPLISLNTNAQNQQSEISIQSINQSEVQSVYTIDKEDFDKQVFDIFNSSTERTVREVKTQKYLKNIRNNQTNIKNYEAMNFSKERIKMGSKFQEDPKQFNEQSKDEYSKNDYSKDEYSKDDYSKNDYSKNEYSKNQLEKCKAVILYRQLVQKKYQKNLESYQHDRVQPDWMKEKSPTQMLASVLTNPIRMDLYVHYLLKQLHLNEKAKIMNQLHQKEVLPYNSTLKQAYTNILYLLSKINTPRNKNYYVNKQNNIEFPKQSKDQKQKASISLYQNGLQIDLNPKQTAIKKHNAERIRELKQQISGAQQQIQETKKAYEEIIINFATTIQNLNKGDEPEGTLQSPLQHPSARLSIHEQEEQVRKKHHTFGMKNTRQRSSSRNLK